jgi:hypothetical protein
VDGGWCLSPVPHHPTSNFPSSRDLISYHLDKLLM